MQTEAPYPRPNKPELWNPNVAIWWSLVFSPIFGALIHAANWHRLGMPDKAKMNMVFVVITLLALALGVASMILPSLSSINGLLSPIGIGLFIGWAMGVGKLQTQYVRGNLGDEYDRRGWVLPIVLGIAGFGAYMVIAVALIILLGKVPPTAP